MDPQASEGITPAWGALPVEKWLLSKWDSASPLTSEEQRRQLVQAFIQQDDIVSTLEGPPFGHGAQPEAIHELIDTVLVPWRSLRLRRIADKLVHHEPRPEVILLRTFYSGVEGDNDKMREWIEEADPNEEVFGDPEDHWWKILDDATLFDTSSEGWQVVYNILPELAAPLPQREFSNRMMEDVEAYMELVEDPIEDDFEEVIMKVAARTGVELLVADQEAFQNDEFFILFRDAKGNTIKEGTISATGVQDIPLYHFRGNISEAEFWIDADVGDKYKTRGSIMHTLLPLASGGRF